MSNNSWIVARKRTDTIKQITRNVPKYGGIEQFFKDLSNGFSFLNKVGECAGFLKSAHKYEVLTVFVPIKHLDYFKEEEKFKEWIDFINELGFPCYFMGVSNKSEIYSGKCFTVNIYTDQYPETGRHLLACHTLIRFAYSHRYKKISKYAYILHHEYDLPLMKALYLAHYSEIKNNSYKAYYGLIKDDYIKKANKTFVYPPDILGIHDWLRTKSINSAFDNVIKRDLPAIDGEIQPLRKGNIKKYIKALKL